MWHMCPINVLPAICDCEKGKLNKASKASPAGSPPLFTMINAMYNYMFQKILTIEGMTMTRFD